jgi:hypothetical protein
MNSTNPKTSSFIFELVEKSEKQETKCTERLQQHTFSFSQQTILTTLPDAEPLFLPSVTSRSRDLYESIQKE